MGIVVTWQVKLQRCAPHLPPSHSYPLSLAQVIPQSTACCCTHIWQLGGCCIGWVWFPLSPCSPMRAGRRQPRSSFLIGRRQCTQLCSDGHNQTARRHCHSRLHNVCGRHSVLPANNCRPRGELLRLCDGSGGCAGGMGQIAVGAAILSGVGSTMGGLPGMHLGVCCWSCAVVVPELQVL